MISIKEIIQAADGILIVGKPEDIIKRISIDSRTLCEQDLFIAIKGDNFDGHDFISAALDKKAAGIIVSARWFRDNQNKLEKAEQTVIRVEDTTIALGKIAGFYRKKFNIPVIAVTGSNGKTTTKEMIFTVLSAKYKVLKSQSSFNNHIGVPLTLLQLTPEHQVAILEIGMNHKGEIRTLSGIVSPNIAVITNAAEAHMGFFNSVSEIAQAKCELLEKSDLLEKAIINADSKELWETASKYRNNIIGIGTKDNLKYWASNIKTVDNGVEFKLNNKYSVKLKILGEHNVGNALAAIAVADQLGIDMAVIIDQLACFESASLRMQLIDIGNISVIADCYNANPQSMSAALKTIHGIKSRRRKIVVVGDMLELGKFSEQHHRRIGELVAEYKVDLFISVGKEAAFAAQGALAAGMDKNSVFNCSTSEDVYNILSKQMKDKDLILFKGSRGMRLEKIISRLKNISYR
ncbi:MAG: UDP-N-acetylmuramoyl-tripeptide--D-alanyl-D-alanine ligase [Candidatus Omnitrophota bacterium]